MKDRDRERRAIVYDVLFLIELCQTPDKVFHLVSPATSHTTIGYIGQTVGYRHTSSRYLGIGHCSLHWWVELCKTSYQAGIRGVVCLCRGHTQQYRLVDVSLYHWSI